MLNHTNSFPLSLVKNSCSLSYRQIKWKSKKKKRIGIEKENKERTTWAKIIWSESLDNLNHKQIGIGSDEIHKCSFLWHSAKSSNMYGIGASDGESLFNDIVSSVISFTKKTMDENRGSVILNSKQNGKWQTKGNATFDSFYWKRWRYM